MQDETLVIRFVGDSGDGMQLVGEQFSLIAHKKGFNTRTNPDFPAEIRAPSGTVTGVSGFQIQISDIPIYTAGDDVDVLVAMNPAALKTALTSLKQTTLIIINQDNFEAKDFKKAGVDSALVEHLQNNVIKAPITRLIVDELKQSPLSHSQKKKAKNFVVLGMVIWLFDLELSTTLCYIEEKFKSRKAVCDANQKALTIGHNYADTIELAQFNQMLTMTKPQNEQWRQINGVDAVVMACCALTVKSNSTMLVSGYPITPASNILHQLANKKGFGITLFQAEDEIAAICASLGAAFGGKLAMTCTSGPGFDLKAEGISLAVMTELPLVIIDVMRAGPSTGLPTKTEQSDLNLALYGRHGEAPLPVIAAKSSADCFDTLIEAFQIAIKAMSPVVMLMDAQLANSKEPWQVPKVEDLPIQPIQYNRFEKPFQRDERHARSWNIPGSGDLIHRIGGLEKQGVDGDVSYDANNHQQMVNIRQQKIERINEDYVSSIIEGDEGASTLIVSWGSTYGAVKTAIKQLGNLAHVHLRYLNPLPKDLAKIVASFEFVLVAELNNGQLLRILRADYLIDAKGINQCNGQPFRVDTLVELIKNERRYERI
jgi:2-oxoglutarate/2-oxoacid ferredoxin oxidoreductase subunit alpha